MKNKIIAGTIAVLFLPASVAFFGLLNEYFLFRVHIHNSVVDSLYDFDIQVGQV